MAKKTKVVKEKSIEDRIWESANKLRGNLTASEYQNVVLGLVFLKYISDCFEKRYNELVAEGDGFEEDRDEYTAEHVFWVPQDARWQNIASKAHDPQIGQVNDHALEEIGKENPRLKKVMPNNYSRPEINKRIAALIEQSVQSDGVVNLFDEQTEFSLFDEKFMEEVKKMKEKNLAAKLLEDLLRGRVRTMIRSNIVTGELFSNRFSETLNRYVNGLITNEEVIQELLKLAQEMMDEEQQGNDLGLSNEEKAFYDALTRPQAVKDFYTNDQLVALTKELADMLRRNRTIDWNRREAERANMRRLVKRLLKQYKYPPEEAEDAMNIVLKQCEQWAENQDVA